jgi:hypothetical protein
MTNLNIETGMRSCPMTPAHRAGESVSEGWWRILRGQTRRVQVFASGALVRANAGAHRRAPIYTIEFTHQLSCRSRGTHGKVTVKGLDKLPSPAGIIEGNRFSPPCPIESGHAVPLLLTQRVTTDSWAIDFPGGKHHLTIQLVKNGTVLVKHHVGAYDDYGDDDTLEDYFNGSDACDALSDARAREAHYWMPA